MGQIDSVSLQPKKEGKKLKLDQNRLLTLPFWDINYVNQLCGAGPKEPEAYQLLK
jgi:hypothetical protein